MAKGKKPIDLASAKRRASMRLLIQVIWAIHNVTNLTNDDIYAVIQYTRDFQDSFNKGYLNYKDVIRSLLDERGLDLRPLGVDL